MKLYKLDAIGSTNAYLKQLNTDFLQDSFTVVTANYQHSGKGQSSNIWTSQRGKNLLFSILIKFNDFTIEKSAYLNFAISIAIYQVLREYLPLTKIKWPNDIMAGKRKICGILIENSVRGVKINHSIVGIGLNVNQVLFKDDLLNATSLKKELNKEFDRDLLLDKLMKSVKNQINRLENNLFKELKADYESVLFKKNIEALYASDNKHFTGEIVGVSKIGLLQIKLESGVVEQFANKEIVYL